MTQTISKHVTPAELAVFRRVAAAAARTHGLDRDDCVQALTCAWLEPGRYKHLERLRAGAVGEGWLVVASRRIASEWAAGEARHVTVVGDVYTSPVAGVLLPFIAGGFSWPEVRDALAERPGIEALVDAFVDLSSAWQRLGPRDRDVLAAAVCGSQAAEGAATGRTRRQVQHAREKAMGRWVAKANRSAA